MDRSFDKMLVVARKYNDIFYALSTVEWKKCSNHYLLMITDRLDQNQYPMQHLFDKVITIHAELSVISIFKQIYTLHKVLLQLDYTIVTMSNIVTVANMFILNYNKTLEILMLEDGLMNYINFVPSKSNIKYIVMKILSLKPEKIYNKISCCYLLNPRQAIYYYGIKRQLSIRSELFLNNISVDLNLEGKSVFIGQPVYNNNDMSINEYSTIVNCFMKDHHIDYYLPHTMSAKEEKIDCPKLDLQRIQLTLEVLASIYSMKLYSFYSSVLFTTKQINASVETYAILHSHIKGPNLDNIIYMYVNDVFHL